MNPPADIIGVGISAAGVVAGLVGALIYARAGVMAWRSRGWPAVPGTVEENEVKKRSSGEAAPRWELKVKYRYRVGEEDFLGDRVAPLPFDFQSLKAAEEWQEIYHPGADVTVFYDPVKPRRAMPRKGGKAELYAAPVGVVGGAMFCFFSVKFLLKHW